MDAMNFLSKTSTRNGLEEEERDQEEQFSGHRVFLS